MCQVQSGSYVSLLALEKTELYLVHRLPPKTTMYILHVGIVSNPGSQVMNVPYFSVQNGACIISAAPYPCQCI